MVQDEEPKIRIGDREELIVMLAEAAAIEHNVMCSYLYGIWSLKNGEADGLTAAQAEIVTRWKSLLLGVAIEEMEHLTLVGNLTASIGGTPYLSRPNFPIPAGYHPAGIDLELVGFSPALIDHAIFLERPEGIGMDDAPEFLHPDAYAHAAPRHTIMPVTQDYNTIGHLYRGIYHGFEVLCRRYGEANLFCGDAADQIGPADAPFSELTIVTDLASAWEAIETIVEQGEGAPGHSENSHYQRFVSVKQELATLLAEDPDFKPAFPVARNPVMRRPHDTANKVWITDPEAARVLDLANSLYALMLRLLSQSFGRDPGEAEHKRLFMDLARQLMHLLSHVAEHLASLPAGPEYPGLNAGMSFTILRDTARLPTGPGEMMFLSERALEIAAHAALIFPEGHSQASVPTRMRALAERLVVPGAIKRPAPPPAVEDGRGSIDPAGNQSDDEITTVEGKDLILSYNGQRCFHSRHCVLEASSVFLANVEGDWLLPDAMPSADLRGVCHNCPSGAITYEPKGSTPGEPVPEVNTVKLRENGPYAFRAVLKIDGKAEGFRAALCRCGASKNKPFCDGSHKLIGFHAAGEPDTRGSKPLEIRDGELVIEPEVDGPLQVSGNLEICSGTGRTIDRVTGARLCRCGGSSTKPFCDNTHLRIGFKST